jgi:hypothetical protein
MPSTIPFLDERLAEAARYALMRRLLPAIRHNIAGTLQPIGMMAAMLERRMQAAAPDLGKLGKNSHALTTLSREAASISMNLMTWLAPRDNDLVAVNGAVEESLGLVSTELSFRGFSVVNQTTAVLTELPKGILRSVFTASLIALTDAVEESAIVIVSVASEEGDIRLNITLEPGGTPELAAMGNRAQVYRVLQWTDVQAIADAEGVYLKYGPDGAQLHYCAATPAAAG